MIGRQLFTILHHVHKMVFVSLWTLHFVGSEKFVSRPNKLIPLDRLRRSYWTFALRTQDGIVIVITLGYVGLICLDNLPRISLREEVSPLTYPKLTTHIRKHCDCVYAWRERLWGGGYAWRARE